MEPSISAGGSGEPRNACGSPAEEAGLPEQARLLWHELRGLAHDHLRLAALETQQAGESLVAMIAAAIILGGLLLSTWLALLAAVVVELTERDVMGLSAALVLAVALNLVAAFLLWGGIRRRGRHLRFPAGMRVLKPESSSPEEGGEAL